MADGGVRLQDHSHAWAAAGLADQPVQAYGDALPPELLAAVDTDVAQLIDERQGRPTYWLPLRAPNGISLAPRSAIEAAIHLLHRQDFGGAPIQIAGAEWWVHQHSSHEDVWYHYDHDEAFDSQARRDGVKRPMRFAEVATITYLRADGAPTVVLNTTTLDGKSDIPETPAQGWLCYPQRNKHLLFRANLLHGAQGLLSRAVQNDLPGSRRTLLVNWWRDKPQSSREPGRAIEVSDDDWRRLGLLRTPMTLDALAAPAPVEEPRGARRRGRELMSSAARPPAPAAAPRRRAMWEAMAINDPSARLQVAIEVEPTDLYFLDVLAPRRQPVVVHDWAVRWSRDEQVGALGLFGPIARLCDKIRGELFREPRPKLVFVLADAAAGEEHVRKRDGWRGALPPWLRALHVEHAETFKFVLADPLTEPGFLRAVGLSASAAPTVVIYDTASRAVHTLGQPFGEAAVRRFVRRFLGQQSAPPVKDEM